MSSNSSLALLSCSASSFAFWAAASAIRRESSCSTSRARASANEALSLSTSAAEGTALACCAAACILRFSSSACKDETLSSPSSLACSTISWASRLAHSLCSCSSSRSLDSCSSWARDFAAASRYSSSSVRSFPSSSGSGFADGETEEASSCVCSKCFFNSCSCFSVSSCLAARASISLCFMLTSSRMMSTSMFFISTESASCCRKRIISARRSSSSPARMEALDRKAGEFVGDGASMETLRPAAAAAAGLARDPDPREEEARAEAGARSSCPILPGLEARPRPAKEEAVPGAVDAS
mmetsp:Transcript_15259/g.32949  ORF Transcript_15259/g.32949 Transcript_15259/m.32949 type:complete len:297 (+) Transcript_15259:254-1144(+)